MRALVWNACCALLAPCTYSVVTSFVTLTMVAILTVGCSSQFSSPTSLSADGNATTVALDQTSGTWTLLSIQPAGQTEHVVPDGASYTLLLADGRISTKADCNVCGGNVMFSGQTMTVGPQLACTRAACPTMPFDGTYLAILEGDNAARIDSNLLTLTSPRGTLHFRR